MLTITLPDGSQRQFEQALTAKQLAENIGPGLAKAALAAKVNDKLVDLSYEIQNDANVNFVTSKDNEDGLEIIRHSTAHLLAHAVKELYPNAQVTIGPTYDQGFFYDFAFERPFTPEDLEKIEKRMQELAKEDFPVVREVWSRAQAVDFFKGQGEEYKVEIIKDLPEEAEISVYKQGEFLDLCRGPHVPSTGKLGFFKLMKVAGAYWRGNPDNPMLQRIYGTAWPDKKQLKEYLHRLEEAEKRDHRKIGKQLDLFHFHEEAPGMVFWHHKGWTLYNLVQDYIRKLLVEYDYEEINTPQILDRALWERSGHWDKFHDMIFQTHSEHKDYAIKPMNCPGHVLVYNQGLKSYRDLPLRLAEFGVVHRNEPSGTLHGLLRVRRFTQDDAHVFCTEEQLQAEVATLIDLTNQVYQYFGFENITMALSTRPEKRVGEDALWDKAEQALAEALEKKDLAYKLQPGEGAFYGPKIEFTLHDCIGREWQCGTIQVDFSMPSRLDAEYVGEDSSRKNPVMIHRAILGSLERFVGILVEHYAGNFPAWLAPIQVSILTITDRQNDYASDIAKMLRSQGIRIQTDLRNEKIGFKIREHTLQRVPYLMILGDKEAEQNAVAIRTREGEDLGSMDLQAFVELLNK